MICLHYWEVACMWLLMAIWVLAAYLQRRATDQWRVLAEDWRQLYWHLADKQHDKLEKAS